MSNENGNGNATGGTAHGQQNVTLPLPAQQQPPPQAVPPFPVDLQDLQGLPLGRDLDPAYSMTDASPAVQLAHIEHTFSEGPFPFPSTPYHRLVHGAAPSQIREIEESPDDYFLAQLYGGGREHREQNPDVEADIELKMNAWALGNVQVFKVDSTTTTTRPFDGACIAIARVPRENTDARDFIKAKRVFSWAGGPHVIFHEVKPNTESWVLMDMVSSQRLSGDQAVLDQVLVHIKMVLAAHPAFVAFVNQIAQQAGFLGTTTTERTAELMSTWYVAFIPSIRLDTTTAAYQLRGMPPNIPTAAHRRLQSIIRDHADDFYRIGLTRFYTRKAAFDPCVLCRSENHPSHACPFPRIPGWFGLTADAIANRLRNLANAGGHGAGGNGIRGRGTFRGHVTRGRGGRGRGN
ncbi:hypothetical protein PM082_014446 [Marasmius tenuissimus]|nr:hypothetical protein PM082_014446 [Marasmius tenuissimus]